MEKLKEEIKEYYPGCKFKLGDTPEESEIYLDLNRMFTIRYELLPGKIWLGFSIDQYVDINKRELIFTTMPTPSGIGFNKERLIYIVNSIVEEHLDKYPVKAKICRKPNDVIEHCEKFLDGLKTKYPRQYSLYFGEPYLEDENSDGFVNNPLDEEGKKRLSEFKEEYRKKWIEGLVEFSKGEISIEEATRLADEELK